jgi:predicted MFS family arabinose efflux permease
VPVAAGAVFVSLFAVRESRDETVARTVDIPGVLTLTSGLAALVIALVEGNTWHWGSARVLSLFALAVIGLASFVTIERHRRVPMVDFSFFRARSFVGANTVAFIVSFAMLAMFFFMALYLQNIRHYTPLQAGIRFLPSTLIVIVMGPVAGRLADRVGPRPLMTLGLLIVAGALFWQSHLTVSSSYAGVLLPGFILMGAGIGLVMSPMSTAAMNSVEPAKAGVASGILSQNRMVGGTFGVAVLGAMVSTLGGSKLGELLPRLTASQHARIVNGLGSGAALHTGAPAVVVHAAQSSFVYALHYGLLLGSAVALLGSAAAWLLVASREQALVPARAAAQPAGARGTSEGARGEGREGAAEVVRA